MTPTYPMISSMSTVSPAQGGPPVDLPGTPPQLWVLLPQPWAIQKMCRYGLGRHQVGERLDDGQGRKEGQHRRAAEDAQRPPGPAGAGRPEEPPGQQRQPGQQQHRGDRIEPAFHRVTDPRLRPGRPGRDGGGHREQHGAAEPARQQRLPREHPDPAGPPRRRGST